jgi:O-antigen/teichoic acid export membrane protein
MARNWLLSVASWAVPLALTFISTPIVVRRLGTEQYGLYAVILGYLAAAFSTGVGKLAAKYIPEYRASGSPERLSDSLSATVIIAVTLGVLQALLLAAAAPFIARDILLLDPSDQATIILGMRIAAVSGLVMINSQVFQFAAQGLHRFDLFAGLTIVGAVLSNAGNVILVLNGFGLDGLLLWNCVVTFAVGCLFLAAAKPLIKEWRFTLRPDGAVLKAAAGYAGSIVVYQTLTSVLYAFERSIVVRRFGAESASYYVIPLMLATYLHAFLASFAQVLFPVVNELLTDRERLVTVYLRSSKIVFIVTIFFLATYLATGKSFLALWLGQDFAERSSSLLVILSLTYAINAISMIVWLLAEAFKAPAINAISSAIWAFAAMPMMFFVGTGLGLEGVAAGRLVGILLTVPLIFLIERRFLGSVFVGFWAGLVVRAALAAGGAASAEFLLLSVLGTSWPVLFLAAASGVLVFVALLMVGRLTSVEEIRGLAAVFSRPPASRPEAASPDSTVTPLV